MLLRQILGPILEKGGAWLPGLSTLKAIATGVAVAALLAAGITAGFWMRGLGEPARIAAAAKPLCDAAIAEATIKGLKESLETAEGTLVWRGAQLETQEKMIARLEKELEDERNGTPTADADRLCIPPGTPWLQQRRPGRAHGAGVR